MILPIKKKYFDLIKTGQKTVEFRDAHISFVCEETGDKIRKYVDYVELINKEDIKTMTEEEKDEIFTDNQLIKFVLKSPHKLRKW